MVTLLVTVVLMAFFALLGFGNVVAELFLARGKPRLGLPGGVDHLHTGVLGALGGQQPSASGALGDVGTALTLSARVLLAGPDPVPQLPVATAHRWSIRLTVQRDE